MVDIDMREKIGKRVQIPVHFDLWMKGARYGTVIAFSLTDKVLYVRMDKRKKFVQLRAEDCDTAIFYT